MHESECSFMLLNVYEGRNIKFDIIETILMQKKKCVDFSNLLSSDFVRSISYYLIVQVTLFLAIVTVLRYNIFFCINFPAFYKI